MEVRKSGITRITGILFLFAVAASAEPLSLDKVPEPLKPWVQWVLDGMEESRCPGLQTGGSVNETQRQCFWPGKLVLFLEDKKGHFRQDWQVYKEGWVPLPGDAKRWPQNVQMNGHKVATILREGPRVRLTPGAHSISGDFFWDSMPELIQIPRETGLVSLTIRGKQIEFPNIDEEGRLWLQKSIGKYEGETRLDVVVHRRIIDEIPLLLVTDIELKVSGKNREVLLGKALLPKFIPTELEGPLPARLERNGRLRVQVRPGDWRITLTSRHEGPVSELVMPVDSGPDEGPWDKEEAWVFDVRPDLRLVSVEGVPSLDPQQTTLPDDWRHLPTYLMRPGDKMQLVERRRGDVDPAPDQLSLTRTWWLDFNGGGYSIRDRINGNLRRSWRLDMPEPTVLGRVASGGINQFITKIKTEKDGPKTVGIEVRQGSVQIEADSRINGTRLKVPAVGWNHDFHQVSGHLNLPPGWRILHAIGVDNAFPTWITRWTLLDIFMVLIIALSLGKLWSRTWGVLSLVTMALCYHEPYAPRWILIFLLASEALFRGLPDGKVRKFAEVSRFALRLLIVIIMVPFLINQVRIGIYPQLENLKVSFSDHFARDLESSLAEGFDGSGGVLYPAESIEKISSAQELASFKSLSPKSLPKPRAIPKKAKYAGAQQETRIVPIAKVEIPSQAAPVMPPVAQLMMNIYAPDPKAQVSTGPGVPSWRWNSVSLTWRGPVKHSQKIWFILIGPFGNFVISFARIILLILLALCIFGQPVENYLQKFSSRMSRTGISVFLLTLFLLISGQPARGEIPSTDTLNDLQSRLIRPAECEPNCITIPRMKIEASAHTLRIRLEVAAGALSGIPLPGSAKQWEPAQVFLDGAPARGLLKTPEGLIYLPVSAGVHQIILEGPLPSRETVEVPLPLKPHRVEAQASGWTVNGLIEDGLVDENLQLIRVAGQGVSDKLQTGTLPSFVRIERNIRMGLSWQIETRIVRVTPLGPAIVIDVPLVPGESVMSSEIRVEKGKARISMGPQISEVTWNSVLAQTETLKLHAPESVSWTEVWRVDANPIWHVVPDGIPVVHSENPSGIRQREWRPWPGESVALAISRPEGVSGQTLTIDRSVLSVNPGIRATDITLMMDLRASRGGQHTLILPEDAELQSFTMDGVSQPVRQEKRNFTIAVLPGSHQVSLSWRHPKGIGLFYLLPEIKLGISSVNSHISMQVPYDRWVLSIWGPRLGPVVLFWSVLTAMLIVSFGLRQLNITPLTTLSWFLLFIGLTQVPILAGALVAGWILALAVRKITSIESPWRFNLVQIVLVIWTVTAICCLFNAINHGLLGSPEMQISGNGSREYLLQWYQDRVTDILPRPLLISLPRMVYRLAMLAWALWIASSLIAWLRWGWSCFNQGGLWKTISSSKTPEFRK